MGSADSKAIGTRTVAALVLAGYTHESANAADEAEDLTLLRRQSPGISVTLASNIRRDTT